MYQFGLKLWSINKNYIDEAVRLYNSGIYEYIELYTVSGSYNDFIYLWCKLDIPYIVHAPHSLGGLNLAKKEDKYRNLKLIEEVLKFADTLKANIIIFHPGIDGDIENTVLILNEVNDNRIVIENKPYFSLLDNLICNGHSPEEIQFIMDNAKIGFCLDIGHAICSANAKKVDQLTYLKEFLKLNPSIYHLTDGYYESVYDRHDHFEEGNYDIKKILKLIPSDSLLTIETDKNFEDRLSDFRQDIIFLRNLEATIKNETNTDR